MWLIIVAIGLFALYFTGIHPLIPLSLMTVFCIYLLGAFNIQRLRAYDFFKEHSNIAPKTEAILKRFYKHVTRYSP